MAKFFISQDLHPGIVRRGQCFRTGTIADFDESEVHLKLTPISAESYALLVKRFGADRVLKQHGAAPHAEPAIVEAAEQLTLKDMYQQQYAPSPSNVPAKQDKGKGKR